MRILFLTSRLPYPPDRGDRYRVFNFLKRLSSNHEITLVSFVASKRERDHESTLLKHCTQVHTVRQAPWRSIGAVALNVWRRDPMQALYYRSPAMRAVLEDIATTRRFDAVYVHLFRMAQYADLFTDAYRIIDLTDAISSEIERSLPYRGFLSRLVYRMEWPRVKRLEREAAARFDEGWVISERDRELLAQAWPDSSLHVIPNGVDPELRPVSIERGADHLVFVGNMSVPHNIDAVRYFVRDIFPEVVRQLPEVRLTIVGADPVRSVRMLERHPAVTVTGFVDDLNEALASATVFVAPLRFAAGVQTKVIEAMAAGRPVVTTGIVNEGIGAVPGRDLLVADEVSPFAEHVVSLSRDADYRRRLGEAARRFVLERFRWDGVVERVERIERVERRAD